MQVTTGAVAAGRLRVPLRPRTGAPTDPLVPLLEQAGHFVAHARDLSLNHAFDEEIRFAAVDRRAVLITHSGADFWMLHRMWHVSTARWQVSPVHPGALILPHVPETSLASQIGAFERVRLQRAWPLLDACHRFTVEDGWRPRPPIP